ncbi:Uncharacterized protein FWK35_00008536 [Aphis craccivora]|uniref:Reverse transcriptase domain-containing protein n=1 Tax=Aphis craccivora TaxID=307492 RepID=A0A6G0ZAG8_APHCR|nr:Uncharacterized protein FWK35_00008536 [Aphis craccivora]
MLHFVDDIALIDESKEDLVQLIETLDETLKKELEMRINVKKTKKEEWKEKNHRGRPRLEFIKQIIKDQGCNSYAKRKRKADKREEWKMTANHELVYNNKLFVLQTNIVLKPSSTDYTVPQIAPGQGPAKGPKVIFDRGP